MRFILAILLWTLMLSETFASILMSETDTSLYFNEENGLIVAEIESLDPSSGWTEKSDRPGFSGTSFFEWTSENQYNNPGLGTLQYLIKINSPGTYRFQWRCKVGHGTSHTDANDSWLRIPDASKFYAVKSSNNDTVRPKGICTDDCPEGAGSRGWFKVYSSGTTSWTWSSRTSDSDPHLIYADFDSAGFYRVQISGRSKYHLLDRFVLHKASVSSPTSLTRPETKVDHRENIPAKLILKVLEEDTQSAIQRAKVTVNQKIRYCDNSGSVFFYKLDLDTTHPITVNSEGFEELVTEISIGGDTLINLELKKDITDIHDFSAREFEVMIAPNPVGNNLHLFSEEFIEEISITDITGKNVYQSEPLSIKDITIELGHLNNGIYFARIYNSGKAEVRVLKFIKN